MCTLSFWLPIPNHEVIWTSSDWTYDVIFLSLHLLRTLPVGLMKDCTECFILMLNRWLWVLLGWYCIRICIRHLLTLNWHLLILKRSWLAVNRYLLILHRDLQILNRFLLVLTELLIFLVFFFIWLFYDVTLRLIMLPILIWTHYSDFTDS